MKNMKNSIVRLEMIKKKISALTWCVGISALSHCMPARDAQSIRCSFISNRAYRGNFSSCLKHKREMQLSTSNYLLQTLPTILSCLLVQREIVWILHSYNILIVIIASCCSHDLWWGYTLSILFGHLNKVIKTHVGTSCKKNKGNYVLVYISSLFDLY